MVESLDIEMLLSRGRAGGHPVAVRGARAIDFDAFCSRVRAWQEVIAPHPGRRLALHHEDSCEFAAALLAAWQLGRCVVLPADARPATVERLRTHSDGFLGDFPPVEGALSAAAEPTSPAGAFRPLEGHAPAVVLFTSGSSGEPVAIEKRLEQLSGEVRTLGRTWDALLGDARVVATVSHQHIYGLLHRVLWPLAAGRPFDAQRKAYPEDILASLTDAGIVLVASPAHLKRLPRGLDWAGARGRLRAVFSSGGPLPVAAVHDCRALLGQAPFEVYGSSETGGVAWRQRARDDAAPWEAFEGVSLRFDDEVLSVRSPLLEDDGWWKTADRARQVADGFLLLGREDRLIKLEEKRISLTAIERALAAGGLVTEPRVVTLPGDRTILGVVAIPTADGRALLEAGPRRVLGEALRAQLAPDLERIALPRRFRFVDALPVNAQGKSTEVLLRELFDPRRPPTRVLERAPSHARLELDVRGDCPFFEGHFPGQPILPGVTQLDWVVRLGREVFELPPDFAGLEALKFQRVIRPGTTLLLSLDWSAEKGRLAFKYASAEGTHAAGRLLFSGDAR